MLENLIAGYDSALSGDFDRGPSKSHRPYLIQNLLRSSVHRRWRHLARERLDRAKPMLPLGRNFWPLAADERAALLESFHGASVRKIVASVHGPEGDDEAAVLDAAYWVKGCSSLGRLRYAVVLRVGQGRKSTLCLIDIKEAGKVIAPRAAEMPMPRDNAVRVVTGARALSPHLGDRMIATRLLGSGVFLRELAAQDLKIEIGMLTSQEATALAAYLGEVLGNAHGRQMDQPTRKAWKDDLKKARKAALDAPSWLWSSVVGLISTHETAYLDHCRRYALRESRASRAMP